MQKNKIAFIYDEKGEYAPRDGYEIVKRDNIAAIIKYKDEYLLLKYNNVNYSISLVTGGIETSEDMVEAVRREVTEETGYMDIYSPTPVDYINISRFFVKQKGQNREATYYPFLIILKSKKKIDISLDEQKEHKCIWVKEKELKDIKIFDNHLKMINDSK